MKYKQENQRNRKRPVLLGAAALAVAATLVPSLPASAQEIPIVRLDPKVKREAVSPLIYGTNHRYNGNAIGTWDSVNHRMDPVFDKHHREAGLKSIRYPGGTVASTFEWKQAIGPLANRPNMQPAQGGEPGVAAFGVDEAARWCEKNGVELVYMYGIGAPNSNPQDAADLVEYLNSPVGTNPNGRVEWARKRAENGHPEPYRIQYFEIANEADGPNPQQRFWLDAIDTDANRAKRNLPLQQQRDAYTPEFCFGGMIRMEKQHIAERYDFRPDAAVGNGQPNQRKMIRYFPITPGSDTIHVNGAAWQRVAALAPQGNGKIYQVDPDSGTVLFGNGVNGDIPRQGDTITVSYRARRPGFVDYYPTMKAVDPDIRIFAGYESRNIITTMGSAHPYDGIVIHPYTNQWNVPVARTVEDWHHNLMLSSDRMGGVLAEYQKLIDQTVAPARRGKVKVICTEYGPNRQHLVMPEGTGEHNYSILSTGLYAGHQLMQFMRLGMPHAQMHSTTVGVFGAAPDFIPSASAMAFSLFSHNFGDTLIGIQLSGIPSRQTRVVVTGSVFHGDIVELDSPRAPAGVPGLKLPRLEAEASRDARGNLYAMVINQDAFEAITAEVQVAGGLPASSAEVWTLNGPGVASSNTLGNPDAVRVEKKRVPVVGGTLRHLFPAHSLTAIRFGDSFTKVVGAGKPGLKAQFNPADGRFEVTLPPGLRQAKYGIFDATGNLVQSGFLNSGKSRLDLNGFSKGLYVLGVKVAGGKDLLAFLPHF